MNILPGSPCCHLPKMGFRLSEGQKKIVGSEGVIPYLNEIPATAISRFLREIEVIDLVGITDPSVIQQAIDSCSRKERNEAPELFMPEIDENSWKKYESQVKQNVMSKIKRE
ncbi:hypothetical protein [Methanosarcina barkeri]|uniref:hypothetical protein n=1 Tax=Methanosarcina barkeri TaxID=2208 RepID=UPI0006D16227|nr:hypothetical protein [Methanosarcina barkeri]